MGVKTEFPEPMRRRGYCIESNEVLRIVFNIAEGMTSCASTTELSRRVFTVYWIVVVQVRVALPQFSSGFLARQLPVLPHRPTNSGVVRPGLHSFLLKSGQRTYVVTSQKRGGGDDESYPGSCQ